MSGKYVPGHIDEKNQKQGTFLEGERSKDHTHKDGSEGYDIEAYRNTYKDDKIVNREKATDWGKIHEGKK